MRRPTDRPTDRPTLTGFATARASISQLRLGFNFGLPQTAAACNIIARRKGALPCPSARDRAAARGAPRTCSGAAWAGQSQRAPTKTAAPGTLRRACGAAARYHLAVMQWARANGGLWDRATCWKALGNGHLGVLQWAHENGCPWDSNNANLPLGDQGGGGGAPGRSGVGSRKNGCPWNMWSATWALPREGISTFSGRWIRANRCEWDSTTCADATLPRCDAVDVLNQVNEGQRIPLGTSTRATSPPRRDISTGYSGRGWKGDPWGTNLVPTCEPPRADTPTYCSGRGKHGVRVHRQGVRADCRGRAPGSSAMGTGYGRMGATWGGAPKRAPKLRDTG